MTTEITNQWPTTIQGNDASFYDITGKFGKRIATSEMAAEYENIDGHRVWMTVAGEVYPE